MSGNALTALPAEISKMASLVELQAENNAITAVPESLGELSSLLKLDLSTNQITVLPKTIGNLTALHRLDVSSNRLTSLPPSIGFLPNMKALDCRYNEMADTAKARLEDNITRALEFLREEQERLNNLEETIIENIDWLLEIADAKNLGMMDSKLLMKFHNALDTADGFIGRVLVSRNNGGAK